MRFTATNDLAHMRASVFFEGAVFRQKLTRFWLLLILASIIAAAGVNADSTATVIGAMIVAPLMTPILGTMLAIVLTDRTNLIRSVLLVAAGAAAAVAIGWLIGFASVNPIVAETNSQVAGRVNPRLIDLVAAIATGVVGSVALVRSDIADSLPGVAIAISLVPPLSVVGLTFESGEYGQSLGALLLFLTNVTAILASGSIVMALYGIHELAVTDPAVKTNTVSRRRALTVIGVMVGGIVVILAGSSYTIATNIQREINAREAAKDYGDAVGWEVIDVTTRDAIVVVRMEGPLPLPDTAPLRVELEERGLDLSDIRVELSPVEIVEFETAAEP